MILRRQTRKIHVGAVSVGGDAPIAVQSMTNTDTSDVEATVAQIKRLEESGCDIVRLAVLDTEAAKAISQIQDRIRIPLIADIHFDYRLAIGAMENGADAIRINPGNLGGEEKTKLVVEAARAHNVSIRVGVNSGSIEKDLLKAHGYPTPENTTALIESALRNVHLVEKYGQSDIKIYIKSSDVLTTINSKKQHSKKNNNT